MWHSFQTHHKLIVRVVLTHSLNALEKHCFVFNIWKMAVEATEIDLYADDLGEEFNQVFIKSLFPIIDYFL
jgi:hypothetical protein